ncbi:egg cell-secreted protein 1.2-like [Typha angustifolia]|uniref:egg cell-secreted protein 1.2-like n=1 Tax=Typha angustifolia TaxID=59011 RepID=UPI003C2F9264
MSPISKLSLFLALTSFFLMAAASRDLPRLEPDRVKSLQARLNAGLDQGGAGGGGGGLVDCWNALLEIKSCTNEIVLFFLNGESYLGLDCCRAIRTITLHCWPSMLTSLGFTSQEGDILRGYCDAEAGPAPAASKLLRL